MTLFVRIDLLVALGLSLLLALGNLLGDRHPDSAPRTPSGLRATRRGLAVGLMRAQIRRDARQARRNLDGEIEGLDRDRSVQ
jgi:hypothetical protein